MDFQLLQESAFLQGFRPSVESLYLFSAAEWAETCPAKMGNEIFPRLRYTT